MLPASRAVTTSSVPPVASTKAPWVQAAALHEMALIFGRFLDKV